MVLPKLVYTSEHSPLLEQTFSSAFLARLNDAVPGTKQIPNKINQVVHFKAVSRGDYSVCHGCVRSIRPTCVTLRHFRHHATTFRSPFFVFQSPAYDFEKV